MTLAVNLYITSSFGLTKFLTCISIIIINGALKNERVGGRLQFGLTARTTQSWDTKAFLSFLKLYLVTNNYSRSFSSRILYSIITSLIQAAYPLHCTPLHSTLSFIHLVVCLTPGPKPLPNQALHIVRSRASSFKCQYPLLSLRSSTSFLCFLPRLPVTSIPPFIFPSITCLRRQFLCKMWPIQLAFCFLISCRIFLCSLTLSNTSSFLT